MNKHTSGPWYVDDSIFNFGYFCIIRNMGGDIIAETNELADAHLIAASPELLEALEVFIARCKNPWTDPTVWENCDEYTQAVTVIAKAKGETQQ